MIKLVIFFLTAIFVNCKPQSYKFGAVNYVNSTQFKEQFGGDLHKAIFEVIKGFPSEELIVVFDNHTDVDFIEILTGTFYKQAFVLRLFNVSTLEDQEAFFSHLEANYRNFLECNTLYLCNDILKQHILLELVERNLIRRNLINIFYWGSKNADRDFLRGMHEMLRVVVITNPRNQVYRIYYNQATSYKQHHLTLVNWWISGFGLYHHPTLPAAKKVFKNFNGKTIHLPVIHKPPWHFVHFDNDTIQVLGGRDDQVLTVLSKALNFKFEYFDPPERTQGTMLSPNGTFEGVLGMIWRRDVEFFIGDVAITFERNKVVEFSFVTLADSGAFVTHSPRRLNEAVALIRPFRKDVWPIITIFFIIAGPILYLLTWLPNVWRPEFIIKSKWRLFMDSYWFTTILFFKQTGNLKPYQSFKSRLFVIILCLCATYIIAGMYSANLISLLARPGREKAISNLRQLENAMQNKGYQLMVAKFSSSHNLLENGTGIYGRLWHLMKYQHMQFVPSVEEGVQMIRDNRLIALLAGRETLFFDIQRFGAKYYHLSEKLNTAYSAIAFQIGCPYIENFNSVLMALFEAGIMAKMTNDEYENLGKKVVKTEQLSLLSKKKDNKKKEKDDDKLQPVNIKMLQGAFYMLIIGDFIAVIAFGLEKLHFKYNKPWKKRRNSISVVNKLGRLIRKCILLGILAIRRQIRRQFNEAIIKTFDYME